MRKLRPRPGHAAPPDFNDKSPDAMFAKILTHLDAQDDENDRRHQENKTTLESILKEGKLTNGRVTKLEKKWIYVAGLVIGGWFVIGVVGFLYTHWPK
jgi:hypothetical protein